MKKDALRIGDIVSVTAKVTGHRGDGSVWLAPIGFDFDVDLPDRQAQEGAEADVAFYSVDEPHLVRRGLAKGDLRYAGDGEAWEYAEDLGHGLHLMRKVEGKPHLASSWSVMMTEAINLMFEDDPTVKADREYADRG